MPGTVRPRRAAATSAGGRIFGTGFGWSLILSMYAG